MKKAKAITFWLGIGIYFINQVIIFALLHKVRLNLKITTEASFWEPLPQYIIVLIMLFSFIAVTICYCSKKLLVNQVGAILGIITAIMVLLFSWLAVTWIFWFINFIACALILVAASIILKLNKEIV